MNDFKPLTNKELEQLSLDEKRDYYYKLKQYCSELEIKSMPAIGQKFVQKVAPLLRGFELEFRGIENIPRNENVLFVCNHSNSHDYFTACELLAEINQTGTILAGSDCLSPFTYQIFKQSNATLIDRNDKESSKHGVYEMSKKMIEGECGVIFAEATWNIHPLLPMQNIKTGATQIGAITEKKIIPTIFEYVEVPDIVSKEKKLYKKCIIKIGKPIKIDYGQSLIEQTEKIKQELIKMRLELWEELGIKKDSINTIDKDLYLNHTYIKKYKAFGFTLDSEYESKFIFYKDGEPKENEYHIDENGNFTPGVTPKK